MKIELKKGKYVIAVSGGVDSVVLLDLLSKKSAVELVVAHFNHGIRSDSGRDEKIVKNLCEKYKLPYEVGYGNLGEHVGEDEARRARYEFLESVRKKHSAKAIVTAHHQDDYIETAVLNVLRGSGRRGLSSIANNPQVHRPLLGTSKKDLIDYAKTNKLHWREDSTNQNEKYLRNRVRKSIKPAPSEKRDALLEYLTKISKTNNELDKLLEDIARIAIKNSKIERSVFINLPHNSQVELLAYWLRRLGVKELDKPLLSRLAIAIKTAPPTTTHSVRGNIYLRTDTKFAHLTRDA